MKNYIHKVFGSILMGVLVIPTVFHAMDKKRTIDKIYDAKDIVYQNMKKLCAPKLQEADWLEIFSLIGNNDTADIMTKYFDIIYNSGQMERLLVIALHFQSDTIIQKAHLYSDAFFAKILCDDNDSVKVMVEKKHEKVNAHHVHMALLLRNTELLQFFLDKISEQELQNYHFNGNSFIEYLIEPDHLPILFVNTNNNEDFNYDDEIEDYVGLFIKHGCKVGYNEVRMVIEREISGSLGELLLNTIADVNEQPTDDEKSLLWHCVQKQLCDWIEKLLHKGAIVTKQNIIENYCIGIVVTSGINQKDIKKRGYVFRSDIRLSTSCSRIEHHFEKYLRKQGLKNNAILLECLNQAVKNNCLIYFAHKNDAQQCAYILSCGADAKLWHDVDYEDDTSEYKSLVVDMAESNHDTIVLLLLQYGADFQALFAGTGLSSYDIRIKNIGFFALFMKLLESISPLTYIKNDDTYCKQNEERFDRCWKQNKQLRSLLSKNINLENDSYKSSALHIYNKRDFLKIISNGDLVSRIVKEQGLKNMSAYALRNLSVARRLFAYSMIPNPYMWMTTREKNEYETWLKKRLIHNGSFSIGHDALLARLHDKTFSDVKFEFVEK